MAHLFLRNSRLIYGFDFTNHVEVNALLKDPSLYCVVLYPGNRAVNLNAINRSYFDQQIPEGRRLVVFIIDGTWHCASRMMIVNSEIAALPQICFNPEHPSDYKFRRQPYAQCVSTIEAVVEILKVLEPDSNYAAMTQSFRNMANQQSGFTGLRARQRVKIHE